VYALFQPVSEGFHLLKKDARLVHVMDVQKKTFYYEIRVQMKMDQLMRSKNDRLMGKI